MTFKEAYNKIIDAYFRDEIEPYSYSFCFCGTLCDNNPDWHNGNYGGILSSDSHNDFMYYTGKQYSEMERHLLLPLIHTSKYEKNYEDALFAGMCAAIEVLKQIHIERGDPTVNEVFPEFTKRELSKI